MAIVNILDEIGTQIAKIESQPEFKVIGISLSVAGAVAFLEAIKDTIVFDASGSQISPSFATKIDGEFMGKRIKTDSNMRNSDLFSLSYGRTLLSYLQAE